MAEASAALQQARVREAWALIEVLERAGAGQSATLFAPRWEASRQHGSDFLAHVAPDGLFSRPGLDGYLSPTNLARFARTLDFIRPGDRLMEIGTGHGHLAVLALQAAAAKAYYGVELESHLVRTTNEVLDAYGCADRGTAVQGNLYELTRETVAEHGADLMICCEVLEHLPDPELALKVLADALSEGTELLVSVPLRGRLEGIWGHVAQFGVARVREMAREAGLTVHHVEALANTWVLMLASRGATSERAAYAAAAEPDTTADLTTPDDWSRRVENVRPTPVASTWNRQLATHTVEPEGRGVRLKARAQTKRSTKGSPYAGVAFACQGVYGVRIEIDPVDVDQVSAVYADFYAGSERVGRWKWVPAEGRPAVPTPTFTLHPQKKGIHFKRQLARDLRSADRFELFVQLTPGGSVDLGLTRLGWFR